MNFMVKEGDFFFLFLILFVLKKDVLIFQKQVIELNGLQWIREVDENVRQERVIHQRNFS